MVEVVHQTTAEAISSPFSFLYQIAQYWGYILIAIIGLILAIVIWVMWSKWEDERHERDDPVYEGYKNLIRDCELNKDRRKIRKTYSLANLLWFGLPFKRKEHSNVIIDYRDNIIGYYRGHSISQDGYYNLLAYKTKWLLFFEEIFLIRCPKQLDIRLYKKDKDGKYQIDAEGKRIIIKKTIDYSRWFGELPNGDIKIKCCGIQKLSYFRYPVYIDSEDSIVDLRKELKEDIIDLGHDQMLSRVLATGSQMVEKAMLHNPHLQYAQKAPEKTKLEQQEESK